MRDQQGELYGDYNNYEPEEMGTLASGEPITAGGHRMPASAASALDGADGDIVAGSAGGAGVNEHAESAPEALETPQDSGDERLDLREVGGGDSSDDTGPNPGDDGGGSIISRPRRRLALTPGPEVSVRHYMREVSSYNMDVVTMTRALTYVGVLGLSNAKKELKIEALAMRLLQLRIPVAEVRDQAEKIMEVQSELAGAKYDAQDEDAPEQARAELARTEAAERALVTLHASAARCKTNANSTKGPHPTLKWKKDSRHPWRDAFIPAVVEKDGEKYIRSFEIPDATSSGPNARSGSGVSRRKDFTANDHARLFHAMACPELEEVRRRMSETRTREEVDAGPYDAFGLIAEKFNNASFQPAAMTHFVDGVLPGDLADVSPTISLEERDGSCLQQHWNKVKSGYSIQHANYSMSGQVNPDSWPNFHAVTSVPDAIINYLHCFLQTGPGSVLAAMAKRSVPAGMERESGVGPNGAPVSTPSSGEKATRRKSLRGDERDKTPVPQIISFHGAEEFGRGTSGKAIGDQELKQTKMDSYKKASDMLAEAERCFEEHVERNMTNKPVELINMHVQKKRRLLKAVASLTKVEEEARVDMEGGGDA